MKTQEIYDVSVYGLRPPEQYMDRIGYSMQGEIFSGLSTELDKIVPIKGGTIHLVSLRRVTDPLDGLIAIVTLPSSELADELAKNLRATEKYSRVEIKNRSIQVPCSATHPAEIAKYWAAES